MFWAVIWVFVGYSADNTSADIAVELDIVQMSDSAIAFQSEDPILQTANHVHYLYLSWEKRPETQLDVDTLITKTTYLK